MNIGVLGLGYVGIVNVACLSKQGHTIYCNDVKPQKVESVRKGKSPIYEPQVEELIRSGVEKGTIIPTDSTSELVTNCDIILSCVGTPSKPDGEVNLDYLHNVMRDIQASLKKESKKYLVCRSTVPPGTTEKVFDHFFSDYDNVVPVFYPEFLREGSAVHDFHDYGRFVLGRREGDDVMELVEVLHVNKERPVFITDMKTSEYSKYIDNSFHALKIVFANEIFSLGSELGVNVQDSHAIFTADDKLNISTRYLRPGLPFGGSCLPKDLRELQYLVRSSKREFSLLPSMIKSNDAFVEELLRRVKETGKKRIAFIGLSFKNNSDDLRESPMLRVLNSLRQDSSYKISIWDEDLHISNLRIDFPYLYSMVDDLEASMEKSEAVVVSKRYLEQAMKHFRPEQMILNFSDDQQVEHNQAISLY